MAYSTPDNNRRRSGGSSRPSRGGAGSSRPMERVTLGGSYHGPRGTQSRSGARGGLKRGGGIKLSGGKGNGGYPLRSRSINFQGGRGRRMSDRRTFILAALGVVVAILLVVGISSCVRGCTDAREEAQQAQAEPENSRVASGLSDELTKQLESALDRNDKLAEIAASADKYGDKALVELALAHPEAVDFVASYPDAEKSSRAYSDTVTKGEVPELFCWDSRWGAVDYGGHALAVTGSGPVAFSMAYMGLTGQADKTPVDIASLAIGANAATGDSGTDGEFFKSAAESLGLSVSSHESSAENLTQVLDSGVYLLVEAKAGTLTDDAHWVLVVSENSDGTVGIYDPTDPSASDHDWAASTIAAACDTFYSVTASPTEN